MARAPQPGRHRSLSAVPDCDVCNGSRRVQWRPAPDGHPIEVRCPHCTALHLPILQFAHHGGAA